jgi:hypothetical protein
LRRRKGGLRQFLRDFRDDRSAIIWVWAVCFLTITVNSLAWLVLGWPTYLALDAIEASYTFPSVATNTIALIRYVVAAEPILVILGMLLWAYVNSGKREDATYPQG